VPTDSGFLEIDHNTARTFSADDIYLLIGIGNTTAPAVELKRALAAAVDAKPLLLQEMNHRVKNNLSLVARCAPCKAGDFLMLQ
jgi:hypothetical protein